MAHGLALSATCGDSLFPFLLLTQHLPPTGGSLSKGEPRTQRNEIEIRGK